MLTEINEYYVLFISLFLFCHIALAKTLSTMFKHKCNSEHACSVSKLRGKVLGILPSNMTATVASFKDSS